MTQLTNAPKKAGGDTHTPQARQDIARREEQIVALRLRSIPYSAIGRQLGVSKQAAHKAFERALRRNTTQDIQSHHRSELAKLELEEANTWRLMDANKDNWKAVVPLTTQLNRIHIRRARLLGLDAPTKLDIANIYGSGSDEASVDRLQRERALAMLPVAEQIRWLEM